MSNNYLGTFLYMAAIVGAFYFLWYRPQQRQRKAVAAMLAALAPGDPVITAGGMYGTVRSIDEDAVQVEIADGVVVRFAKGGIVSRLEPADAALDD
jgi:preprotein translocase subunit YajC